jgi:putative transposase
MADLRNRGVRDILIACVDGLAGFAGAITAAFPSTVVQRCVVHLIRNSLRPVARRDAAAVAAELRKIYTAPTAEAAFDALAAFTESPWGRKYPQAARVWEQAWDDFTPFLAFTPPVRKMLYTTNSRVRQRPHGMAGRAARHAPLGRHRAVRPHRDHRQ